MHVYSRFVIVAAMMAAATVTWVVMRARASLGAASASMRTSSAPGARLYELLGWLIGGLYDRFAEETARALVGTSGATVLEVGPGPGELAARLARRVPDMHLVGIDVDPAMVALAEARVTRTSVADRVRFVVGDVVDMPFEDGTFDLVVSSFSAHHWPDGATAFAEIRRVLRPGGRAIVYDLPDGWGRFETGAGGLVEAAMAGGFGEGELQTIDWPWRLAFVRRLVVLR